MLTAQDFEGLQGFGNVSMQDVDELSKALSAGSQNPPVSGGSALRVESLDSTLRVVTYQMEHLRLWKLIPKSPAYSTVEEFNRLNKYGNDSGGFFNSGGLPEVEDTDYARVTKLVKFLGTQREVTHPMTLVRVAHGDVIALETQNGTRWILNKWERAGFFGDSTLIPLEFDGIFKQVEDGAPDNVIDLEGNPLTEADLEQGANIIAENFGVPTHLHLGIRALSDLATTFYSKERYGIPATTQGQVGFGVKSFASQAGLISLEPNVFIRPGDAVVQSATSARAPTAPSVTGAAVSDTTSKLPVESYVYHVTGLNAFGESIADTTSTIAVAANERVDLSITDNGGADPATAWKIYRRLASQPATDARHFKTIPAATLTFEDRNFDIPGTSQAIMVQGNSQNYAWKQLAPLMRMPLATVAASYRWLQLLYGTPIVYTPTKNVIYKNIGHLDDRFAPTGF